MTCKSRMLSECRKFSRCSLARPACADTAASHAVGHQHSEAADARVFRKHFGWRGGVYQPSIINRIPPPKTTSVIT
jgi:hypothetical protein